MTQATPVPEDFHTITPHLVVRDAARAVAFYERALGAEELYRNLAPDGHSIVHSELVTIQVVGDPRMRGCQPVSGSSPRSTPIVYSKPVRPTAWWRV